MRLLGSVELRLQAARQRLELGRDRQGVLGVDGHPEQQELAFFLTAQIVQRVLGQTGLSA
ncbi:hypothetical protein BTW07_11010 [Salinicola socius]|uniref:Uncharacterized protein n=2 Tax=Salinicola socius TaxID=404433 RepID=A0A1Q8SRT4_9GAMM|nr:hypothetical protein BTW07_11010 [Salinicola socius]